MAVQAQERDGSEKSTLIKVICSCFSIEKFDEWRLQWQTRQAGSPLSDQRTSRHSPLTECPIQSVAVVILSDPTVSSLTEGGTNCLLCAAAPTKTMIQKKQHLWLSRSSCLAANNMLACESV